MDDTINLAQIEDNQAWERVEALKCAVAYSTRFNPGLRQEQIISIAKRFEKYVLEGE